MMQIKALLLGLYHYLRQLRKGRRPRFRDFMPRSLFGRSLLILVLPVIVLQAVVVTVYLDNHWRKITQKLTFAIAAETAMLVEQVDKADGNAERMSDITLQASRHLNLLLSFTPDQTIVPETISRGTWQPLIAKNLSRALEDQVRRPFSLIYDPDNEWVLIRVQMDGGVLDVQALEKRLFSSSSYILLIWMVATSFVLIIVAVLFLRNQIRPIRKLAVAAERFGRGQDVPTFKPEGAREVRAAAKAFLDMHERIKRQIAQRTAMLAGISHDLRTPLTRLKLGLSILPQSPDVQALEGDIQDMEKMVNGYLDFVRGEGDETTINMGLVQLLAEVYHRAARQNCNLTLHDPIPNVLLTVRPQAISRALMNLITNAAKYAGKMDLHVAQPDDGHVVIVLDDDGPGIAPELREDVFRPFFRGEPSRNQSTGGIGLGLAITRDIIAAHGGTITLDNSPKGGLRVIVTLPV